MSSGMMAVSSSLPDHPQHAKIVVSPKAHPTAQVTCKSKRQMRTSLFSNAPEPLPTDIIKASYGLGESPPTFSDVKLRLG
jgi:hypothetical protein